MVAVRMVSEGVDVPRLAVGVYATTHRRRRCSSPRPSAGSCGPGERGETASVFLPSVPHAARLRLRDGGGARPRARAQGHRRGRHLRRRGRRCSPQAQAGGGRSADEELGAFEALGSEATLRPGALRRRRVRPRGRGARRLRRGDGLPRHPRPARARPGARPAAPPAERARASCSAAPARPRRRRPRASPPTSSSPSCAASSTAWSPRGTTAPASRTASPTPRCARTAAARPPPSRPPSSCRSGSTGSGTGPPKRLSAPA